MYWIMTAEYIAIIIIAIMCIYSRHVDDLNSTRTKLFQLSVFITFLSILSNIICIPMLINPQNYPLIISWIATSINFMLTPLTGVPLAFYSIVLLNEHSGKTFTRKYIVFLLSPTVVFLIVLFSNPITKYIFDIQYETGYVRGPLSSLGYVITYFYLMVIIIKVILTKSTYLKTERIVLSIFPAFAAILIIFQHYSPQYVLAGIAAAISYLILYLYLENKHISIDYLTNLPHRQVLLEKLSLKKRRKKVEDFLIISISLREFKQINNNFGQQYGNACLRQVSSYLSKAVVPYALFRFSGDEFAILIDEPFSEKIGDLAISLKKQINSTWKIEGRMVELSCVIGIVQNQENLPNVASIFSALEYAVTKAKKEHSADYIFCSDKMIEAIERKRRIIEILKDNLANDSFQLYYQPILDIKTSYYSHAEALLRLNETEIGPIYPEEFIPIAEESGLIIDITYQVIDKACKFTKSLLDSGKNINGVSVNLSALQFQENDLKEKILAIISKNNIPYSKIKFEITESMLIDNFDKIKEFIVEMKKVEISFSLDDFGIGYSNITSVIQLPFDVIKLDKSLVWSSIESPKAARVTQYLARLFNNLDLLVLAEGVETKEQAKFVEEIGCDLIQGYLYARPMREEEAREILCRIY